MLLLPLATQGEPVSTKGNAIGMSILGFSTTDFNDALLVLRFSLGLVPETALDISLSDLDGNGSVTANDALAILRKSLGLR